MMRGDDDDDEAKRLNAGVRIEKVYIVYWNSYAVAICNARLRFLVWSFYIIPIVASGISLGSLIRPGTNPSAVPFR